jgi:hypothetical protein
LFALCEITLVEWKLTTTPVYTAHDFTNVKNIELSNLFELIFIRDHAWFIPSNIYL